MLNNLDNSLDVEALGGGGQSDNLFSKVPVDAAEHSVAVPELAIGQVSCLQAV